MKHILILIAFLSFDLVPANVCAQLASLQNKLEGKDKVEEIMDIVDAHYAEIESGKREKTDEINYKHWARWGLYMAARADDQGRLVNVEKLVSRAYHGYNTTNRSSTGNWIPRGPNSLSGEHGSAAGIGRVDRIAFHPTNANIIYIGTPNGGLFKSSNGGSSWTAMTDNIPSVSVSGIVVSHADPNVIYILTGNGDSNMGGYIGSLGYAKASEGVFVSYNGGSTWYKTGAFPVNEVYTGFNLAQDPIDEDVLLAATSLGVYRTSNGGDSWVQVLAELTYEVKFKPGSSLIAYATQDGKFYQSMDGGITWSHITNFGSHPLPSGRVAMAVTNAAPGRVYLLSGNAPTQEVDDCGDDPDNTFGGVFLSTNSGTSFTRPCNSPNIVESCCDGLNGGSQSNYDLTIGVSHSNYLNVVAGGIRAWRSTTGGITWINATAGNCDGVSESTGFVHADVHDVEYNPLNGHVFLGSDGGLIKSTNNGIDWINVSDGIAASQIYLMAGTTEEIDNLMIGTQDNGCKRRNANTSVWDSAIGGDGYDCIYDWESAGEGYATSNSKIYRFEDNGATTENITGDSNQFFTRVTSAIDDAGLVLAGLKDIYRSENFGDSWVNKGASGCWDIERCPSNVNRFYASGGNSSFATTGSMYRSSDRGSTWTTISDSPGYAPNGIRMGDIDVRPTLSSHVWIVFGGFSDGNKVFFSNDAGESWSNMPGSLPNVPVNAIQVDAGNNAYIGTDIGVFYRGAGSNDWVPFWHRLPIIPVTDLELYEADQIIRASTFGRGVWESDVYSTCPQVINMTTTLSGNRYYETSNYIECGSLIIGGQNTRIILKADNYLLLKPGFDAHYGNTVHAYLAPCGVAQIED